MMTLRRLPRLLMAAVLVGVGCGAGAQPAAITGLYEELRMAIETEDTNAVLGVFAPLMQLQASAQAGWLGELSTMFTQRENIAVEMRFDENQVIGQKALILVTWAFSGKTTETGEPWSQTEQRVDLLVQKGPRWQMLGSDAIDQEATKSKIVEGRFADADTGLEAVAPGGWRMFVEAGAKASVAAFSPDLNATLNWVVADLPGTFTAEQLARGQQDALTKLAPTLGLEFRDVAMAADTLGGRSAFRVRSTVATQDGLEVYSDLTYCVVGPTVYVLSRSAIPPNTYPTYEQAINRAVAATMIIEAAATQLPPEAGRLDGQKYINDVYGCQITAPPDWTVRIGQGQFRLQVTMSEPGGDSSLTLAMVQLPRPDITAEMAVKGDDNIASQAFEGYKLIRTGETTLGDLPAYESLTTFDFGGQKRQRHRVYLVDNDRLFFMFADAAPADKWNRLAPLFDEAFKSFKLIEATP
ncbi:MAG: hypothetical protein FJX75_02790 [Armatimonadetes bacterium]|nr:hypothetical protein [Armatimonadota bacterium]